LAKEPVLIVKKPAYLQVSEFVLITN